MTHLDGFPNKINSQSHVIISKQWISLTKLFIFV